MRTLAVTGLIPSGTLGRRDGQSWSFTLAPGACAASISRGAIELCLGHRREAVLARQGDETLTMFQTARGIEFDARVTGWRVSELLDRQAAGDVHGLSPGFGFGQPVQEHWPTPDLCVVTAIELLEISIVVGDRRPCIDGTRVFIGLFRGDVGSDLSPDGFRC